LVLEDRIIPAGNSANSFDGAYVKVQLDAHEEAVALFVRDRRRRGTRRSIGSSARPSIDFGRGRVIPVLVTGIQLSTAA
jgi:hypothetical protein